jgi:glucan phosphoethanolaminetransferase (alkaline phosphatase superfamily)
MPIRLNVLMSIVAVKVLLLLVLFWSVAPDWAFIIDSTIHTLLFHQKYLAAVVYCAVFLICILAIWITPFLKSWRVRIPLLILFVLSFGFDQLILDITGTHLNTAMLRTIWIERSSDVSLDPYSMDITLNVFRSLIIFLILALPTGHLLANRWTFIPVSAIASVAFVTFYTKGGTEDFPPPLTVVSNAILAAISTNSQPVAAKVTYNETPSPLAQHIVYIVDESVRGDYIQLNNKKFSNTPFLSGLDGQLINFGVATSGANCSAASRMILRLGTRQGDAPSKQPGLFQYAQRAGFRTVVVDAWKELVQYMDPTERLAIDTYVPVIDEPPYLRDNRVVEKLLEILADDRPTFIYVAKFGVHFPYDMSYPSESKRPLWPAILPRAIMNFSRRLDGTMDPKTMDPNKREELVNSYNESIAWSVDGFFQRLQPRLDLTRTLLLYTSDHGQTMWEDGHKATHCSSSHPHPGESYVPLFALTEVPSLEERFRKGAASGFNRASHFDVFPTLLLAMGYKERWINSKFGSNLIDIPSMRHREFLIGGSLGTNDWSDGARWVTAE